MSNKQKVIAFDLDDVLCSRPKGIEHLGIDKYKQCTPIQSNIDLMNQYYDDGHKIVVYTARGMTTLKGDKVAIYDYLYRPTFDQLKSWGAKFHELYMGKMHYDVLVDDKAVNPIHNKNVKNTKIYVDYLLGLFK